MFFPLPTYLFWLHFLCTHFVIFCYKRVSKDYFCVWLFCYLFACSKVNSLGNMQSCKHHHNQNKSSSITPPTLSCCLCSHPVLHLQRLPSSHWFFFLSIPIVLPFPDCLINGIIQCVAFWIGLLSLSITHEIHPSYSMYQ